MDRIEQKIAERTSAGKTIVAGILTSGVSNVASKNYQQYIAMGNTKTKAVLKSLGSVSFLAGHGSRIAKARYIRRDD
jgi:hypothetical protein